MNDRKAMEQVIRFNLQLLQDERELSVSSKKLEQLVIVLVDEESFLEGLKTYMYEYLELFGENYGVEL